MSPAPDPTDATRAAAEHRERIGRTLRGLRASRGLTLRELAALLEVSPATVSSIENGRTGLSSARVSRWAEVLDVPVARVFADAEEADAAPPSKPPGPVLDGAHPTVGDWRSFPPLVLDPALGGALSAFLEFGYHGATMRTIAERAGLSVPGSTTTTRASSRCWSRCST